jgi:pimeloyl-ACP methyl ester carboxylesterase
MQATYNSKTILFITGAFVTHHVWHNWITWFEGKGFTCIAPAWPHKNAPAAELRSRRPNDTALAKLTLGGLVAHFEDIAINLPEKPIVIGHSLGGLIVQVLVNKGLAESGVALHSVPPKGVFSFEWPFLKSIWKPLGYLTSVNKTHLMGLKEWGYAFTNGMDAREQQLSYETYCIPESKRVIRGALSSAATVDFDKPHPPLLFITGDNDHITPNSLNYENYIKYEKGHSITDYKEFKGRNHFVLGLPTWKEEAEYICSWLELLAAKTDIK